MLRKNEEQRIKDLEFTRLQEEKIIKELQIARQEEQRKLEEDKRIAIEKLIDQSKQIQLKDGDQKQRELFEIHAKLIAQEEENRKLKTETDNLAQLKS